MKWLLDTSENKPTTTEMVDIHENFFNLVDWPKVFQALCSGVVESCRIDTEPTGAEGYKFLHNVTHETAKKYAEINEKTYGSVGDKFKKVLSKLNKDLETFCMEVST
mmetsp:Transcript_38909/g.59123  ORF Transcript_38909/g.59123 Transcript_38909/m.59123 type:complete len:107 (+) Transcript_38909:5583-5903(+)